MITLHTQQQRRTKNNIIIHKIYIKIYDIKKKSKMLIRVKKSTKKKLK